MKHARQGCWCGEARVRRAFARSGDAATRYYIVCTTATPTTDGSTPKNVLQRGTEYYMGQWREPKQEVKA